MFINSTQLKKLMKRDYKDVKLTIGNIDNGYSIMGSTWMVHIAHDGMPNIVKSLIIELAGILPGKGEIFSISKQHPDPQFEIDTGEGRSAHVVQRYQVARYPAFRTNVYEEHYEELYGLIQSNLNGAICHIRKELLDLIDLEAINYDIENLPGNPCYAVDMSSGMIWHNGTTTLLLLPGKLEDRVAGALQKIVFDPYLNGFEEDGDGK
ncbi:MAG: hypothetical protein ACLUOI_21795 [Eisenbergiella sp.]